MTRNQRTAAVFLGATGLTGVAAGAYLLIAGFSDANISLTLRISGRVAFAVLIVVFAARPLQQLLRTRWSAALLRNRKSLGVAFAGIHTAHLGLILLRSNYVRGFDFEFNFPGATVYTLMYAMVITSFSGPARAIGPRAWKGLHTLGLYVLFFGFLLSQLPLDEPLAPANGVLLVLAAVAMAVRIAAFVRRPRR